MTHRLTFIDSHHVTTLAVLGFIRSSVVRDRQSRTNHFQAFRTPHPHQAAGPRRTAEGAVLPVVQESRRPGEARNPRSSRGHAMIGIPRRWGMADQAA